MPGAAAPTYRVANSPLRHGNKTFAPGALVPPGTFTESLAAMLVRVERIRIVEPDRNGPAAPARGKAPASVLDGLGQLLESPVPGEAEAIARLPRESRGTEIVNACRVLLRLTAALDPGDLDALGILRVPVRQEATDTPEPAVRPARARARKPTRRPPARSAGRTSAPAVPAASDRPRGRTIAEVAERVEGAARPAAPASRAPARPARRAARPARRQPEAPVQLAARERAQAARVMTDLGLRRRGEE